MRGGKRFNRQGAKSAKGEEALTPKSPLSRERGLHEVKGVSVDPSASRVRGFLFAEWGRVGACLGPASPTVSHDRREIQQNPVIFPHFKGHSRREVGISLLKNDSAPKPAVAAAAGRYRVGIIIAPEYKPAAKVCLSPGARGAGP